MDLKNELYDQLLSANRREAEALLLRKQNLIQDEEQAFSSYIRQLRKDKQCRWNEIARIIGISPRRLYKLISGEKRTRNRDLLILIGLCMHVSVEEMQLLLALYGFSVLYVRRKRDALIMKMLQEQIYDISEANSLLQSYGEPALQISMKQSASG